MVLDGEQETLGLYLSSHPISRYLKELSHYGNRLSEVSAAAKAARFPAWWLISVHWSRNVVIA